MRMIFGILGCLVGAGLITGCCMEGCRNERTFYSPTTFSDSWEKPSASEKQKQADWIACGGNKNGKFRPPYNRKTDGDFGVFLFKEYRKFQHCLIGKGYRYTGVCIGNMPKTDPACGAP